MTNAETWSAAWLAATAWLDEQPAEGAPGAAPLPGHGACRLPLDLDA